MSSLLHRVVPLLVLAVSSAAHADQPCPGISPETARRVFERVGAIAPGAGYRFDGVGTDQSQLTVRWSRDGQACPPIHLRVENCESQLGGAELGLHVPDDLLAHCPGLREVTAALAEVVAAERPVGQQLSLPSWAVWPALALVALVLCAGLAIRRLLDVPERRRSRAGDAGWVLFVLAAAVPFYLNLLPAVTLALGLAWIVFALLLYDRALWSSWTLSQRGSLAALVLVSLLVDWWLSSRGPGELHLNLASIWSADIERRWGPAPIALFRVLGLLVGEVHEGTILWCNLVLASLVPLLIYVVVVELGVRHGAALLAALVVAMHPVLIAFSGVLERQPTYLFAAIGSTAALLGFLHRGAGRALVAFVLGAILAVATRPEGAQVFVLYIAALLAVVAPWRRRCAVLVVLAVLAPLAFVYTHYGMELVPTAGRSAVGAAAMLWSIPFDAYFTPSAWIVAWLLGLALGLRQRAAWMALIALIGFDLVWRWSDLYRMFVVEARPVSCARYQTIILVPFAIGMALFFDAALRAPRWAWVGASALLVGATAATYGPPYDTLLRPFTVDHEYRFLARQARTREPDARIYVFDAPFDDLGFMDAHKVARFVDSSVRFDNWSERRCDVLGSDSSPHYLYLGSSCAAVNATRDHPLKEPDYANWLSQCAAMRDRLGPAVDEVDAPARPMVWHAFKDDRVRFGLYRLDDRSVCDIGPRLPDFHD